MRNSTVCILITLCVISIAVIWAINRPNSNSSAYDFGRSQASLGSCNVLAQNYVTTGMISLHEMGDFESGCRSAK